MLIAFKEELKRMAIDPQDEFHSKVRKRIGKRATQILEKRLKQMILLMPSLVARIKIYWDRKDTNIEIKKLSGFVFAYLYNPKDFLSKDEHGMFGYLDDAYLVALVYEKMLQEMLTLEEEDREFLESIKETKKYVKSVIPKEVAKIEEMVEGAIKNDSYEKFASAFQGAA